MIRPSATQLLDAQHGLLTRSHLVELGLSRRGCDAVFRCLPNVYLPGYSRPHVKVADYNALIDRSTTNADTVR